MKNAAGEPEHLRDALASLPEPFDVQNLALPHNRSREQEDFPTRVLEEILSANDPVSYPNIR